MKSLGKDYGEAKLQKDLSARDFWSIFDELVDEWRNFPNESSFLYNRNELLDAWKKGHMSSIYISETDSMFNRRAGYDDIFVKDSGTLYLLPCFIIMDEVGSIDMLWVAKRARRLGIGTSLVKMAGGKNAQAKLRGSESFWKSLDIINDGE